MVGACEPSLNQLHPEVPCSAVAEPLLSERSPVQAWLSWQSVVPYGHFLAWLLRVGWLSGRAMALLHLWSTEPPEVPSGQSSSVPPQPPLLPRQLQPALLVGQWDSCSGLRQGQTHGSHFW